MSKQIRKTIQNGRLAQEQGFTIVELMIATLVFSVILVVITLGVLSFTNAYYKGSTGSTTQTAARAIADNITQAVQFSKASEVTSTPAPTTSLATFCAGNRQFLYQLGKQVSASSYGLYMLPYNSSQACTPATGTATRTALETAGKEPGLELLGPHMRLAAISVGPASTPGTYKVSLRVVYGEADLLCNSSVLPATSSGGCAKTAPSYAATTPVLGDDVNCKSVRGSHFCSVSALSTAVQSRVEGS